MKQWERELPFAGSHPRWLQWPALVQTKARSFPYFPTRVLGPRYSGHLVLLSLDLMLVGRWIRIRAAGTGTNTHLEWQCCRRGFTYNATTLTPKILIFLNVPILQRAKMIPRRMTASWFAPRMRCVREQLLTYTLFLKSSIYYWRAVWYQLFPDIQRK